LRGLAQQLIGIAGDRDQGLQALEQARTHGVLSGPEAASFLAKIYALPEEKGYDKAYALLEHLVQRYPNNIDYRYRLALVCAYLERWDQARQVHRSLVVDIERDTPYYPRQLLPLLHYRLAETYVLQGEQLQDAIKFLRALQTQELSPALRAWVELRLGNVHDLRGERQAAQAWYKDVKGDEVAETLAQAYLTTPCTPPQMALKPLEHAAM
jgi:tetratricopeptide (TPR) repeat protein